MQRRISLRWPILGVPCWTYASRSLVQQRSITGLLLPAGLRLAEAMLHNRPDRWLPAIARHSWHVALAVSARLVVLAALVGTMLSRLSSAQVGVVAWLR
jgi:hypothetical protein